MLEFTEEANQLLTRLADAALKGAGLAAHDVVSDLKAWIKKAQEPKPE